MERRANLIQRSFIEERQNCISFSNIQEASQNDKQVYKSQIQSLNKQNSPCENSTIQIRQPSINTIEQLKNRTSSYKKQNQKQYNLSKNVNSENEFIKWNRLNDIIKRIKFKKYIKAFLQLSQLRLQRQLTTFQIQKINDLSYWSNSQNNQKEAEYHMLTMNSQFSNSSAILNQIKSIKMPIFLPHSLLYEIWLFIKISSAMICFFCYLVCFALSKDLEQLFPIQLLSLCQLCIFLDIFITLNTGIYIKGILCTDRRELFSYYKSSKAIYYDICSTFFTTLYYLIHFNGVKQSQTKMTLLLPIIFKHNDFYVIIKKLKQKFLLDRRAQNIIELINLLKNILVISHIFACIWLFIGLKSEEFYQQNDNSNNSSNSNQQPTSWLDLVNITESQWYVQYLNSYYFIAVTMSTVGYGDIRATNPIEVLVAVFFVMTCSVIYGFTLNNIGEIFQDFFQFEKQIQEKRYIIANYMNKNSITQETRQSIFEYLEYYWKDKINENTQEENSIISQLSDNLKEDLLIQSNRLIFKENRVLRDNFSQEVLTKCLPIIQEIRFTQNEIIIDEQNGNLEFSIFFVLEGEVEVIHKQNNLSSLTCFPTKQAKQTINKYKQISILNKGDSFGEKSFFTGQKNSLTFRSKSYSKLLKIKREDFINILQGDQEQYEIFCSMNDRLTFSTNQCCLQLQCQSCKDNTHDIIQCPYLHFVPRKLKLFEHIKRSEPHQNRSVYHNRRIYKQAALENNNLIQSSCAEFFENNSDEIIQYENQYHTFRQFLGSRTLFVSDEDIDQIPRSIKESSKEKRLTTSDFSDSSQMSSNKKFNFTRRLGLQSSANNQTGNTNTKDQFYQEFCNTLDEFFYNTANLLQPHIVKSAATKDIDALAKSNQDTDVKQDTTSISNSTAQIEKQIYQSRQQFLKLQMLKEGQRVQFNEKRALQQKQYTKEKTQQSFKQFKQDYSDYDLFGGEFEKMATFSKYFPKSNYKNVIDSINKYKKHKHYIKDSAHVNTSRRTNRNIQTVINRDINTSRTLSRLKIKVDTPTSRENTLIKSSNVQQNGTYFNNSNIKLKTSYLYSLSAYSQNESNLEDVVVIKNQQIYDEPNTPVRNEYDITSKQEVQSLRHFKTQQYFNIDDTQLISVRKEDIEISTPTNRQHKLEKQTN
ncbi:hypothetical protein ABPG74_019646 [Tetrahymena malaccensis]